MVLNLPGSACALRYLDGLTGMARMAIFLACCLYAMWTASYLLYFLLLLPPLSNRYLRTIVLSLPFLVSVAALFALREKLRWADEITTTFLVMLAPNVVMPFIAMGSLRQAVKSQLEMP